MEDKKILEYIDSSIKSIGTRMKADKENFAARSLFSSNAEVLHNILTDLGRVRALEMMKIFIEQKGGK